MNGAPKKEEPRRELFEAWFSQYAGSLLAAASRVVGVAAAEDVVHDVFVRLWERFDTVPQHAVGAWLFRAVRNRALDTLAHRHVGMRWIERVVSAAGSVGSGSADAFYDSSAVHADTPLPDLLEGTLELLSGRQREVLILHCIDGVPLPEIAARLGISLRTAEKHLQLAARQLRKSVE